jgi:hypothetical protein
MGGLTRGEGEGLFANSNELPMMEDGRRGFGPLDVRGVEKRFASPADRIEHMGAGPFSGMSSKLEQSSKARAELGHLLPFLVHLPKFHLISH